MAWMLYFRELLKPMLNDGCASYLLWDSSPQAGHDYEMSIWEFVSNSFVPDVQADVAALDSRHFLVYF